MEKLFTRFASVAAIATGSPWAFIACLALVIGWAASGPVFGFNETWQLVINTSTTIITFLMVFLIQNSQNRDSAAIQAKLDELIYAQKGADAGFIGIEHLTDKELGEVLKQVEARGREIRAGKPARAVRGKPAARQK